jgi:uncharacterized protein (TIGR02677 family)
MKTETNFQDRSVGRYTVFAYLNTEKATLYRAILHVFVTERTRFTLALRPAEVQTALETASAPSAYDEDIEAALRQLCDWGNLDDSQDNAEAASIEEFYRRRRLYQLSADAVIATMHRYNKSRVP